MQKISVEFLISLLFFLLLAIMAFVFNGTGDDGDSIKHYLFAKYAFQHPENFFDHWAKPLYIIISSPFAQFGFIGIKIANSIWLTLSLFFTLKIAKKLGYFSLSFVAIFFIGAPIVYAYTLSGLTEPMFACLLAGSILLAMNDKYAVSAICFSFLPFIRSEGIIILIVVAFFFILIKQWRYIPLLISGHIVFGILGWPFHDNPLWVISKIPYAAGKNFSYGSGTWDYYLLKFDQEYGLPITILLIIGLSMSLWRLLAFVFRKIEFNRKESILIYLSFIAFFVAHSIFWAFGWFNSFGLMRVFLGVLPLIALIGSYPLQLWFESAQKMNMKNLMWIPIVCFILFGLKYKQNWNYRLTLNEDQIAFHELDKKYENQLKQSCVYTDALYPSLDLNLDLFNSNQIRGTNSLYSSENFASKSAVIWDYRYSIIEGHLPLEKLQADKRFKQIDMFTVHGKPSIYLFMNDTTLNTNSKYLQSYNWDDIDYHGRDSTLSKSGKFSFRLDQKTEFSPGLNQKIEQIKTDKIRVHVNYYYSAITNQKPLLVWSIEDEKNKTLSWNSHELISPESKPGQWNEFIYDIYMDRKSYQNSTIKVYFWNTSNTQVNLDDLSFEAR